MLGEHTKDINETIQITNEYNEISTIIDQRIWKVTNDGLSSFDTHLWPLINKKITGNLKDELLHFTESISNQNNFAQEPEFAAKAIKVIDGIFESLKTGNPCKIN